MVEDYTATTPKRRLSIPRLVVVIGLLLAWIVPAWADAADPVRPPSSIGMLVDTTGRLSIDDVAALPPSAFAPVKGNGVNMGYLRDPIWLRLTIVGDESGDLLLSLSPNIVDLIDVHVPGRAGEPGMVHALGDHRPLSSVLSGLDDVVRLRPAPGEPMTVYVRAMAVNTVMSLQLALYSLADHTYRTTVTGLVSGGWFGGMAILLIIQLVFYYYDRKPYYLLLAFSTFIAMLVYFGTLGLSRRFLFPHGGIGNDYFTAGLSWFGISASALAGRSILELPRVAPWLDRVFVAAAIFGVVGVGFVLAGHNVVFAPWAQRVILVLSTLALVQALRTIDAADPSSHLRAAAIAALWVGLALTIAQRAGLGEIPEWVSHSYAIGCVLYTVLLTGALAQKLRTVEAANASMREQALFAAQASERHANELVEERTRELAKARQVAVDALDAELESQRRQVRFMEVIRHQYRTPLAAIQTQVSNIDLSLAKGDADNRRRLQRVRRGISRLVEVLEVNLSRSRLQGPAFEPSLVPSSPVGLAEEAASRAGDLLSTEILLTVAPEVNGLKVAADGEMFTIALINLIENAAKFTPAGRKQPVLLKVERAGTQVVFRVEDKGIGIEAAELERVFEPRFRGANAANIAGTGTGLSLVSRIVAAHGGDIGVTSAVGEGTTVTVALPALSR